MFAAYKTSDCKVCGETFDVRKIRLQMSICSQCREYTKVVNRQNKRQHEDVDNMGATNF